MSTPTPRTPGVKYETKVENLIVQDREGRKKYEKLLAKGWEVEVVQPRRLWRGSTYTFRRPVQSEAKSTASVVGGLAEKALGKTDSWTERMQADTERMKAERQAKRAAKKANKKAHE